MHSIHIILLYFVERIRCSNYHQIYVVVLLWLMFDIRYRLYLMYGIHTHLNATLVKTHCTVNAFIRKIKTTKMLILCCFVGWPHMSDSYARSISFHKNQSDYFGTKTSSFVKTQRVICDRAWNDHLYINYFVNVRYLRLSNDEVISVVSVKTIVHVR